MPYGFGLRFYSPHGAKDADAVGLPQRSNLPNTAGVIGGKLAEPQRDGTAGRGEQVVGFLVPGAQRLFAVTTAGAE